MVAGGPAGELPGDIAAAPYTPGMSVLGREWEKSESALRESWPTRSSPERRRPAATAAVARSPILLELVGSSFSYGIYDWLQDLALWQEQAFDTPAGARLRAGTRIDVERTLDHWLAHDRSGLPGSNFYSNAIFAVTFVIRGLSLVVRPDLYALAQRPGAGQLIGFAVFWAYPVAPRAMLRLHRRGGKAGGLGLADTLVRHADQYRGDASMHLGYAVWCSLAAWRVARHRSSSGWPCLRIGYPLLTVCRPRYGQPLRFGRSRRLPPSSSLCSSSRFAVFCAGLAEAQE